MSEEQKEPEQKIPDYGGPVEVLPPVESVKTEAEPTKDDGKEPDTSAERLRLENEAFKRHFSELNDEIEEIRRKFHVDPDEKPDPVKVLSGEVSELKNGFDELKNMLASQPKQPEYQTQYQQPMFQPQIGYGFQPMYQQPMFQTSTILPAPQLPYFQTPNFMPMNTQLPQISTSPKTNQNTGTERNGGK